MERADLGWQSRKRSLLRRRRRVQRVLGGHHRAQQHRRDGQLHRPVRDRRPARPSGRHAAEIRGTRGAVPETLVREVPEVHGHGCDGAGPARDGGHVGWSWGFDQLSGVVVRDDPWFLACQQ